MPNTIANLTNLRTLYVYLVAARCYCALTFECLHSRIHTNRFELLPNAFGAMQKLEVLYGLTVSSSS
jgi:hypothetical protein